MLPALMIGSHAAVPFAFLMFIVMPSGKAAGVSYEGVVIHEMPELYEADGITFKSTTTKTKLRFITNRPEQGAVGDAMGRLVPVLKQAIRSINKNQSILPDYVIELHLTDSDCSTQFAAASSLRLLVKNEPGFFHMQFGPLCSGPTGSVNDIIQVFKLFQLATISRGAFLSDGNRYPYLCRTSPSLQFVADGICNLVQLFGWTRIGAVQDTRALSGSTVTEFKAAVGTAIGDGYTFDSDYLYANSFEIDGKNFKPEDIVSTLKAKGVKVALIALYEDVGAPFYCQLSKQGVYGKSVLQTILALSWWGDTWIVEQVEEVGAETLGCTADEIFVAAKHMFSMGQTAFLPSETLKHEITGDILSDIYRAYVSACTASDAEGCHFDFAAYDYDGFAAVARAFHVWLYDQKHTLAEIDYNSNASQIQLYEIVKRMSFLGVSGNVAFFDKMELDCERQGTFSVRQYMTLARNKGDSGWSGVTSFTTSGGFATIQAWEPIIWYDESTTYFGKGSGFRDVKQGVVADFGNSSGLDNAPIDWIQCEDGQTLQGSSCVPCQPGEMGTDGECEKCSMGKFAAIEGSTVCVYCEDGLTSDENRMNCIPCAKGEQGLNGICDSCPEGKFAQNEGSKTCLWCEKGKFQRDGGSSACIDCPKGNISNEADPSFCKPCPVGQHQPNEGQYECLRCDTGTYQNLTGQSGCVSCTRHGSWRTTQYMSALSIKDCVCQSGYYEPFPIDKNDEYKCDPCKEGMTCAEGSRLGNWLNDSSRTGVYPVLNKAYYSTTDDPVYVYLCLDERDCPGGDPGSCASKREGFACGRCEKRYYGFGGKCNECTSLELTYVIFPLIPLIVAPMCAVFIYTRLLEPMNIRYMDGYKNRALALVFFYIVHFQTLGIIRQFNLVIPDIVAIPWEGLGMLNSGIQFLRPECAGAGAMSNFSLQFTLRTLLPLFVGFYFAGAWVLFRFLPNITASFGLPPTSIFTVGMDLNSTINAFGTVMYTFSIAVLAIAFDLFKCYPHPNGLSSLRVSPDVLCDSDDWKGLLAVGILAILIYFVASYTLFSVVCYIAPVNYHDPRFRRRWKFLFVKWRPSTWWFGQVFLMKGVFLNLTLVMFQGGAVQIAWTGLTLTIYMMFVFTFTPWRHYGSFLLDSIVSFSLLCISMVSVYFAIPSDDADASMDKILIIFTAVPILCTTLLIATYGYKWLTEPRKEIVNASLTAFEVDRLLTLLRAESPASLLQAVMATTQWDRQVILSSLTHLLAETCETQDESFSRRFSQEKTRKTLLQREAKYDLPGRQMKYDTTGREFSHSKSGSSDFNSFVAWCHRADVDAEASRIFGDRVELTTADFAEAMNAPVAMYASALLDAYEQGTVPREMFVGFAQYAKGITLHDEKLDQKIASDGTPHESNVAVIPDIVKPHSDAAEAAQLEAAKLWSQWYNESLQPPFELSRIDWDLQDESTVDTKPWYRRPKVLKN